MHNNSLNTDWLAESKTNPRALLLRKIHVHTEVPFYPMGTYCFSHHWYAILTVSQVMQHIALHFGALSQEPPNILI